jgi:hypothetical protein
MFNCSNVLVCLCSKCSNVRLLLCSNVAQLTCFFYVKKGCNVLNVLKLRVHYRTLSYKLAVVSRCKIMQEHGTCYHILFESYRYLIIRYDIS